MGLSEARRATGAALRLAAGILLFFPVARPATLADYQQKVGVYVWGKLGGGLAGAAADLRRLGADRVVRVYIGPSASWDPSGKSDNSPLDVKVQRPDYKAFLAGFRVVMFTAYDSASFERYKWGHLDAQHLSATREEFRRFTLELAKTPGRKIISNWEFENDCHADQWDACAEYYQVRLDGIVEGRKQAHALRLPGEILTAFEFLVVPGFKGKPSGLAQVGARLKGVDYISYSSWWSIGADADTAKVYKDFEYLAGFLHDFAAKNRITTHLIVGEFGEYWNLHPHADRMKALIDASLDHGVDYLFNWVLYDQPGNKDEWGRDASHFGKYTLERTLTPQGKDFRAWFVGPSTTRAPAPKAASAAVGP